ncbi:MAG: A/G-specific adenine glycosylase [Mesorhizobium sp.]
MNASRTLPIAETDPPAGDFAARLLDWYDRSHRDLPWRVSPAQARAGVRADPYRVWLSEIMLQQTTVQAVRAYYADFLTRWPDVASLAAAENDDVMRAWAGLGYYSRARNLKKCAEKVVADHDGRFPDTEKGLLGLPGVGPYTAAAIAAIAFGRPSIVIDGNVERVIARHGAISTPLPAAKSEIRAYLDERLPHDRPGDFAQALMDLGATICTPRRPACVLCPLRDDCAGIRLGDPQLCPVKAARPAKPKRVGAAFVALRRDGAVLLRKRPEKGLLGGMAEVPTTGWTARLDGETGAAAAPIRALWQARESVSHVFTHFELELSVYRGYVDAAPPPGHWWSTDYRKEALPNLMKKVIEAALDGQGRPAKTGKRKA